jgi:hypothetical protein
MDFVGRLGGGEGQRCLPFQSAPVKGDRLLVAPVPGKTASIRKTGSAGGLPNVRASQAFHLHGDQSRIWFVHEQSGITRDLRD